MNIQNLQVFFISKKQEINHRLYKRTQGPTCHLTHARNLIVGYCWGWFLGHRHSFWDAIWNTRRCEFSYSIHVYKCIVISVGYSDGPQISCFLSQQKTFFRFWNFFSRFSRRRMTRSTKRFCTPCPLAAQPVLWNQRTPRRTHTPFAMSLWTAAATTCFAWRTPGPWELSWAIYPPKIL